MSRESQWRFCGFVTLCGFYWTKKKYQPGFQVIQSLKEQFTAFIVLYNVFPHHLPPTTHHPLPPHPPLIRSLTSLQRLALLEIDWFDSSSVSRGDLHSSFPILINNNHDDDGDKKKEKRIKKRCTNRCHTEEFESQFSRWIPSIIFKVNCS